MFLIVQHFLGDFKSQLGQELKHGTDDDSLRAWIEKIANIRSVDVNGNVVYFSEAPQHAHMTTMIRRQKKPKIYTNSRRQLNMSSSSDAPNQSLTTPKSWANTLIYRRTEQSKHQSISGKTFDGFKVPKTPRPKTRQPQTPRRNFETRPRYAPIITTRSRLNGSQSSLTSEDSHYEVDCNNNVNMNNTTTTSFEIISNFEEPVSEN